MAEKKHSSFNPYDCKNNEEYLSDLISKEKRGNNVIILSNITSDNKDSNYFEDLIKKEASKS